MFLDPAGVGLRRTARALTLCCVALLGACGGGGGDDGGGQPAPPQSGAFTISATSATFSMLQGTFPAERTVNMTVTGTSGVAGVGAAFPASQGVPQWLGVSITGTLPNFVVHLQPIGSPVPGHYTATLLVGTGNSSGEVLQSREIAVTLDVIAPVSMAVQQQLGANFVFGHSTTTAPLQIPVQGTGASWTLTSNAPWLVGPAGTRNGSETTTATINVSALAVGTHSARLRLENAQFPTNFQEVDVVAVVEAPTLTVTTTDIVLGGADGLSATPQPFTATLNTGTNPHPWTLQLAEDQTSLGWMTRSAANGTVSGTQNATVNLNFDRTKVTPGRYTGTARFDVTVNGVMFSASAPVTLNVESHRLYPESNGVAFSSFPSREDVTRNLLVLSSRGQDGIAWTATSDQNWLTVTPMGVTGDVLSLTADPDLVPSEDQSHIAIVTLASTDVNIERTEQIRVGIWVGSTDPVAHLTTANLPGSNSRALAVNPVVPLVYSVPTGVGLPFQDDTILIHNAYTGAAVGTPIELTGAEVASLGVSSDGRLLFALDMSSTDTVYVLDAATGSTITTYDTLDASGQVHGFLSVRPNGHDVIWTPTGEVFDTETHERVPLSQDGTNIVAPFYGTLRAATSDGARVIAGDSSSLQLIDQSFTVLGGNKLRFVRTHSTTTVSQWDLALTASGQRVFVNEDFFTGRSYGVEAASLPAFPSFPVGAGSDGIQAIEATWDGRVFYAVNCFTCGMADNVFAFDEQGNSIGTLRSGPNEGAGARGLLGLTGDLRRIVSTQGVPNGSNPIVEHVLTFDDVP
jgi:hypothetical protein